MLALGAAAMWLSAGAISSAAPNASAGTVQGLAAAVPATLSWVTGAGCTQDAVVDFGENPAGSVVTSPTQTGCIASNKKWGVSAQQTAPLTNTSDATTMPAANLVVQTVTPATGGIVGCDSTNTTCTLDSARTLFTAADKTATQFDYRYVLTVPAGASGGTYTGGAVTLTAAN